MTRTPPQRLPSIWRCERFELDEGQRLVRVGGQPVKLEQKPFSVLLELVRKSEQLVAKDELIAKVWPRRILSDTVLTKCITRIRTALGDEDQSLIKTEYGLGYRLSLRVARHRHPWQSPEDAEREPTAEAGAADEPLAEQGPGHGIAAPALHVLVRCQSRVLSRYAQGCEVWAEIHEFWSRPRVVESQLAELAAIAGAQDESSIERLLRAPQDLLGRVADELESAALGDGDLLGRVALVLGVAGRALGCDALVAQRLQLTLARPQLAAADWAPELRLLCAGALIGLARHDEARSLLNALLIEAQARHGGRSGLVLDARLLLARADLAQARRKAGVSALERLLADLERWYPGRHFRAAQVRQVLADERLSAGDVLGAREQFQAADRDWADCSPTLPAMALPTRVLGVRLLLAEQRPAPARLQAGRILDDAGLPVAQRDRLLCDARALRGLAALALGDAGAACEDLREACRLRRAADSERHPRTRWTLHALALGLVATGEAQEAAQLADRALYFAGAEGAESLALSATLAQAWIACGLPDRARYLVEPLVAEVPPADAGFREWMQFGRACLAWARALAAEQQKAAAAAAYDRAARAFERGGSLAQTALETVRSERRAVEQGRERELPPGSPVLAWITWD